MNEHEGQYWVYVHDPEGDLVEDLGNFTRFQHALDAVGNEIKHWYTLDTMTYGNTVRIVDTARDGTTIWMAGPTPIIAF